MEDMEKNVTTQTEAMNDAESTAQEVAVNEQAEKEERRFTQNEVDEIVRRRLEREHKKYESLNGDGSYFREELLKKEKELTKREYIVFAKERLREEGLPVEAADFLNYNSKEEYEESCARLINVMKPLVQRAILEKFKANGRIPGKGSTTLNVDSILKDAFKPTE